KPPEKTLLADRGELVRGGVVDVQVLRADVVGAEDAVLAARRRPGLERERDERRGAREEFPRERGDRQVREGFLRRRRPVAAVVPRPRVAVRAEGGVERRVRGEAQREVAAQRGLVDELAVAVVVADVIGQKVGLALVIERGRQRRGEDPEVRR